MDLPTSMVAVATIAGVSTMISSLISARAATLAKREVISAKEAAHAAADVGRQTKTAVDDAVKQIIEVQVTINGRMQRMLKEAGDAGWQAGRHQGEEDERKRHPPLEK